jgi:two-component system, sensor histidine kinase and response regulator
LSTNQPISFEERKDECQPLVLVVDDDHTHRKLMELLAERLDITAQCVSSCAEALAVMDLFSFDLILMDCRMPDLDGCECTRRIRELANENATKIPIIAVTACVTQADQERCMNAGMDDYLMKPFTLEQMHEKLRIWLHKRAPN